MQNDTTTIQITWVMVAHRDFDTTDCPDCARGPTSSVAELLMDGEVRCATCGDVGEISRRAIFHSFRPDGIEYIVSGRETAADLANLERRGITPVIVRPVSDDEFAQRRESGTLLVPA